MRTVALLCLLAILIAVGALWSVGRAPRRVERVLAPRPTESTAVREEVELLDALADTARGADSLPLSGTVVALDELGAEHRREDGRIFLALLEAGGARSYIGAEVHGGRWSVDLARMPLSSEPWVAIESCSLGKRVALPEHAEPQPLPGPAGEALELRVRWLANLVIHVTASDDGRELEEVVLEGLPDDLRRPEPLGLHVGVPVGRSPVYIERDDERWLQPRILYARGPDHAWGRIEVDQETRDVELVLDPAGTLELSVDLHPWHEDEEITLVSQGPEPRLVLEAPLRLTANRLIEGLAPGAYSAEARCRGQLVGSEPVEIIAGEMTSVTLVVEAPSTDVVPLEGTLTIPAGWKLEDIRLAIGAVGRFDTDIFEPGRWPKRFPHETISIPRSEMSSEPGSSERFRWSAGLVPAGRYQMMVLPLRFREEVDTGSAGTRGASIELSPPARVSFACIDAHTGERVDGCRPSVLQYSSRDRLLCWLSSNAGVEGPLVVPSGRLSLVANPRGYELARRTVTVEPGTAEVALALWPR